jgi:DNA-directed RNA polymerase III subunit RPC1
MSSQEIVKASELHVSESILYTMPDRRPAVNGVVDTRLGTTDKKGECTTCSGKLADCPGHFGYVKLELPVFHIGYLKTIISTLQCICKVGCLHDGVFIDVYGKCISCCLHQ